MALNDIEGTDDEGVVVYPFDAEKIVIFPVVVPQNRLLERLSEKTIKIPKLQRNAGIWTGTAKSRLIESLMLRIPLPMFYAASDNEEVWSILDGLQRISAIREFCEGGFKLQDLEFLIELNGKYYNHKNPDLVIPAKYKNRIRDTQYQFSIVRPETPPEAQRNIFKRLNTGGLELNQQEIRHALYYGEQSSRLLGELSTSSEFLDATGRSIKDERMEAQETILRFLAFALRGESSYPKNGDMDSFLSETMVILNIMPDVTLSRFQKEYKDSRGGAPNISLRYSSISDLENLFKSAMLRAPEIFGDCSFRKATTLRKPRTRINKALFEVVGLILAKMSDENFASLKRNKKLLMECFDALLYRDSKYKLDEFEVRDPSTGARLELENGCLEGPTSKTSLDYSSVQFRFVVLRNIFGKLSAV